ASPFFCLICCPGGGQVLVRVFHDNSPCLQQRTRGLALPEKHRSKCRWGHLAHATVPPAAILTDLQQFAKWV
ncbi:MAG: hypothetical protein ACYTDV_12025, partial [Planctomycetota bacterium]